MKNWVLLAILAAGGYAAFTWYKKNHATAASQDQIHTTSIPSDGFSFGLTPGIPVFDNTAVVNRPDQVAAAMHVNQLSTLSGGAVYEPAFGPTTNQDGGLSIF